MTSIDTQFARVSQNDNVRTEQSISTSVASVDTRNIECTTVNSLVMPKIHIDGRFRIDASPFVNRPFYLQTVSWPTTKSRYSLLNTLLYHLPRDVFISNESLKQGLKIGSLYRSDLDLQISVAGTITHAGCILVGLLPPIDFEIPTNYSDGEFLINSLLSGPHAFLHANEATSVCIKVPWYCNTDLDSIDAEQTNNVYRQSVSLNQIPCNHATLVFLVLQPLLPSDGSSTSLSITVEAIFNNLDIYVPTPRYVQYQAQSYFTNLATSAFDGAARFAKTVTGDAIDSLREGVRNFTGLHNPNTPVLQHSILAFPRNRLNNVDVTSFMENLDPYANADRVVSEPIFNSTMDEMAINHIIGKKQYIGMFRVNVSDPVGTRLFNRPIGPFQGGMRYAAKGFDQICNNIEFMTLLSRAWKGTIRVHIQSVMNNKQQVKLRLLQLYNPSTTIREQYPVYSSILQAPSHLMEFTGGGQVQTVDMPYLSRNRLMPTQKNSETVALLHGEYYIYVAQPMANSSGSPADIFFNVYIELCDDFVFYGYATEYFKSNAVFAVPIPIQDIDTEGKPEKEAESDLFEFEAQSLLVMNSPQDQSEETHHMQLSTDSRLQPIIDVRPLIRRLCPVNVFPVSIPSGSSATYVFPCRLEIGESVDETSFIPAAISRMYYGKHAGVKYRFTLVAETENLMDTKMKFYFSPASVSAAAPAVNFPALYAGSPLPSPYYDIVSATQHPLNCVQLPSMLPKVLVYEFSIPNTNLFKFIGGPDKMINRASFAAPYAVSSIGDLVVSISPNVADFKGSLLVEAALTDETRLGFHCLAPRIRFSTNLRSVPGRYTAPQLPAESFTVDPAIPFLYYSRT